jgi:hypothetical protein
MNIEYVDEKRLIKYTDMVSRLNFLIEKKESLKAKYNSIKGIDYQKIKVDTGNQPKLSSQEKIAMAIEKVSKELDTLKFAVKKEHEIIKVQIARISVWQYRYLLVFRYLDKKPWNEIRDYFFENQPDYNDEPEKYKTKIMKWRASAIRNLIETSSHPFVPIAEQLSFS